MSNNIPTKDQISKLLSFLQNNNKKVFSTVLRAFLLAILILSIFTSVSLWKKFQKKNFNYVLLNGSILSQKEEISSLENQIYKSELLLTNLHEIVLNQYDILEFLQTTNLTSVTLKNYQNNLVVQGHLLDAHKAQE